MTDDEQFGRERYFFAEETIAYPYSDCEDRAVLFSHMVEALLNCPSIGIFYPNHVSAAVHLDGYKGNGYRYTYEGREYLSCDPTYINSLVGMAMSNFEGVSAEIIPVQANFRKQTEEDMLWEQLFAQGRFPASSKGHIIPSSDGKYYVCGYDTQSGPTQPFIGKTNANGTFDWMHIIRTPNGLYRPALFTANGNIYITGQATISVTIGNQQTIAGDKLLFLAALSPTGEVKWLQGYEAQDTPQTRAYMYTLASDGSIQNELRFPETAEMETVALVDKDGILTLSGIISGEGIATASANVTHSIASAAVPDMLHNINNKLIADNTDSAIAGVFAFIEMLNNPGQVVEGKDVVAALDKYNPTFKQRCPNIYKNIAGISLVVNESGVITVQTGNGKPVSFDKVRIQSGSKVNLRHLPSKDVKLEIIDGVKVGAAIVWFKLNHVILYRKNGDLLFDYDKNHTTKTFNLAKDILN
ncbi:MAG: hypothetical protein LIP01_06865 [Tannerellaceae bacterium]|nr:hypothetical protein [Tannerellaceae bacterium]